MEKNQQQQIDSSRVNWLRAAVLGANDGIVSVAALIIGVASAYTTIGPIIVTGLAGLVGGALSMAVGEYVSVSSQRDVEKAMFKKEKYELENNPEQELEMLAKHYEKKGLSPETAHAVALQLTDHDALEAHAEMHGITEEDEFTNPNDAAFASGVSFTVGGAIPLLAIIFSPAESRILITFVAVLIALAVTGVLSAKMSHANPLKVTIRVLIGGALAMLITSGLGLLVKQAGL
jgi:VIT1/CCC1 family predicted Fe2+/Mn2+ transporter